MNWFERLLLPAHARRFDAACRALEETSRMCEAWMDLHRHEIPPDEEVFSRHPWLRDSA